MNKPRVSARPLTEGALFAALAVVLSLIGFYVPVLGLFVVFLWPVPIAMIAVRHGMRMAVLTVVTAALVLSMFVGVFEAIMTTVNLGLLGLAFGYSLSKAHSATRTLLIATLAAAVGAVFMFVGSAAVLKINIFTQVLDDLALAASETTHIYESMAQRFGIPMESLEPVLKAFSPESLELTRLVLPGGFMLGLIVTAYLNYEVFRRIMPRFGYEVKPFPAFKDWRFPRVLAILYVLAQGLGFLKTKETVTLFGLTLKIAPYGDLLYRVGLNIVYPLALCVVVQGMALLFHVLIEKVKWTDTVAKAAMFMVFLSPLVLQLVFTFGLMDMFIDYRRFLAPKAAE